MKHFTTILTSLLLLTSAATGQNFQTAQLSANDASFGDYFGSSVAISGSRAIVGAYLDSTPAGAFAGSATIFERAVDGGWPQVVKLTAGDAAAEEQFGATVAIDGDRAVVGCRYDDNPNGVDAGAAYIFERNISGVWSQVAKIRAVGGGPFAFFGSYLVLTGDRVFVGAPDANVGAGIVYVFERDLGGSWIQVTSISASDAGNGDSFGRRFAASGDRLLVGSTNDDTAAGNNAGSAYVFERNGLGVWTEIAKLTANDGAAFDQLGMSVGLVNDCALAGAHDEDNAGGNGAGSVYVFERQGSGLWLQTGKLTAGDPAPFDAFGFSLDFEGDLAVVGAAYDDPPSSMGSAYLFRRSQAGVFTQIGKLTPSDLIGGGFFGCASAIDGERVVIGAQAGSALGGGSAYVYRVNDGCVVPYGTGTPGCSGAEAMGVNTAPEIGMSSFGLTCTNAPPSTLGLGLVTDVQDLTGNDLFGIGAVLHVDLVASNEVLALDLTSNTSGLGSVVAPIPNAPILVGKHYFAQALWVWNTCPLPPFGFSSSNGIDIRIVAP